MKQISYSKLFDPCCKSTILHRILEFQKLEKKNKGDRISCRNLLNKWFQDSVKNYIMEANAAPLLLRCLSLNSIQEVKQFVHSKIDKTMPKYMSIIHAYYDVLIENNKAVSFCNKLLDELNNFNALQKTGSFHKKLRKQFVCLLILTFFEMKPSKSIKCFADLWNLCFQDTIQPKENHSKAQKICRIEYSKTSQQSLEMETNYGVSNSDERHIQDMSPSENSSHMNSFQPSFDLIQNDQQQQQPSSQKKTWDENLLKDAIFENQDEESNISYTPTQPYGALDQAFIPDSYNHFSEDIFEQHNLFYEFEQNQLFSPSVPLEISQKSQTQLPFPFNQPSQHLSFSQNSFSNSSFSQSSDSPFSYYRSFIPLRTNSVKQQWQTMPSPLFLHQF